MKRIILLIISLLPLAAAAQYYDQGVAPASIKWSQIKTPYNRIVFPSDYLPQATRVMHYLDTVRLAVSHGYRVGAMRMPVVLQTHNFSSNGLVMLAPKRMELIVAPPAAMTPEPWLKQLTTHESRHAVQYNLMNRHFIKGVSYVLGQQGSLIGVALFPIWAMEGDAVMAETELSTFGRGLQPSFTIEYRAMLAERPEYKRWAVDKWFCGSMRDYMPDHYQLGYQMTTYAWTRYGENVWDKVGTFASKYPFLIFTTKISMWKYYRTSVNKMSREVMADLDAYWRSLPERSNSSTIIPTPITSYTTYSSPLTAKDGRILAFKSDLDRPSRIVWVDPATGEERTLLRTGRPNSPLSYDGRMLLWSELRYSKFWGQKVNSQLCWADLWTGKKGVITGERQVLFPTTYGERIVFVQYDYDGTYSIREHGRKEPLWKFPLPVSIHGLAVDALTQSLYFIAVDEGGMYIGAWVDNNGEPYIRIVKPATYSTINDLRAEFGVLYFTSTQSGRDEAHAISAATGEEVRLSDSRYGSFSPAPDGHNTVMTTYTPEGYLLARQPATAFREAVPERKMPENVVNPPRVHWDDVPLNMDSIVVADTTSLPVKRYRKGLHMVNVHSWAPLSFDAAEIVDEMASTLNAGVTVLSQDLLNSTIIEARWAWMNGTSRVEANIKYEGLIPKFELDVTWGGGDQLTYNPFRLRGITPGHTPYLQLDGRVYLPVYFDRGSHTSLLQPSVDFQYSNGLIYNQDGSLTRGVYKLVSELQYSDQARMAYRDLLPRWGYAVRGNVVTNPCNSDFTTLYAAFARGYLPGILRHHSLMLRAAWQWQSGGYFGFQQKDIFPKGVDTNIGATQRYQAAAADYQFPVVCPDMGIASIVYFKRIRFNLAGYYARYRPLMIGGETPWQNVWSYGGDIIMDVNLLRAPASGTNLLRFSFYHPSDRKGLFFGFDFTLPI